MPQIPSAGNWGRYFEVNIFRQQILLGQVLPERREPLVVAQRQSSEEDNQVGHRQILGRDPLAVHHQLPWGISVNADIGILSSEHFVDADDQAPSALIAQSPRPVFSSLSLRRLTRYLTAARRAYLCGSSLTASLRKIASTAGSGRRMAGTSWYCSQPPPNSR